MFTGLIEETGAVRAVHAEKEGIRLVVESRTCGADLRVGDSLAVNGCCLTLVERKRVRGGWLLRMDLLQETWKRTSFRDLQPGNRVNLERALSLQDRLGGHFVTGHIDGVGILRRLEVRGVDRRLEIEAPPAVVPFLVEKGSIAVDGISLTLAGVRGRRFSVWIIPHTWERTQLEERRVGDRVNLEADLLGKYLARFLARRGRLR